MITITHTGSGNISDNYTLMCSVDIVDDLLIIQVTITFSKVTNGSSEVLSGKESLGDTTITAYFTPLRTSDSGIYRCSVDIRQAVINYQDVFYELFTINTTSKSNVCVSVCVYVGVSVCACDLHYTVQNTIKKTNSRYFWRI